MDTKNRKLKTIFGLGLIISLLSACDFGDNYDGPNANFHGQLIDQTTGSPLYSEQPNGFQIRFKEVSWGNNAQPQNFYGKYDGSFNWDHLFGYKGAKYDGSPYQVATYEVEPYDGAFEVVEPKKKVIEVTPNQRVSVNFEVIPFIVLTEEHSLDGNVLKVAYSMVRPNNEVNKRSIEKAGVIISSRTQYLSGGLNTGGWESKYSKFKAAPQLVTYKDGKVFEETITLDTGKTYWVRIGAKAKGTDRWNYTKVIEIKVP